MTRSLRRARRRRLAAASAAMSLSAAALLAACIPPPEDPSTTTTTSTPTSATVPQFDHVGTFDVRRNGNEVAEIVSATPDGRTLVYTDSATASVGVIDVTTPAHPLPAGRVSVGGSPTSVAIRGNLALVATDTSTSFTTPSGELKVIDLASRTVLRTIDLGGQPDSVRVSPDGAYVTIIIENQRDEESNDGLIPQLPAGNLTILDVTGEDPAAWSTRIVELTGIAEVAPEDPEPEYADINEANQAVVSLQENNHLAVVDLATGTVTAHFTAGSATAEQVDAVEEAIGPDEAGDIQLVDTVTARREPDTVMWIDGDTFATANEGDYEDADGVIGGSRSFTLFNVDGTVEHEAGGSFEHEQVRAGHHNESRAENKGGEPEAGASGRFGERQLLFVGAERSNVLGVYDVTTGTPVLSQVLPTGIGPEGIALSPQRGLVAVANETADGAWPSMVTIYRQIDSDVSPAYPALSSEDEAGAPIPWVAQSGLVGDPVDPDTLYSVSDSILGVPYVYTIDAGETPARVVARTPITGAPFSLDLEGVAIGPDGELWLASEGTVGVRPNAILRATADGVVQQTFELPAALTLGATSSGFEGLAITPDGSTIYAAIQRPWADDAANTTKLAKLDVESGEWTFATYPLNPVDSPAGGWVGLSEITLLPNGEVAIIERDNQVGADARIKRIYGVDLDEVAFAPHGEALPTISKRLLRNVLPDLDANSVLTPDKLEGLAVTEDGRVFTVTDNDGLDGSPGQTVFLELGRIGPALGLDD